MKYAVPIIVSINLLGCTIRVDSPKIPPPNIHIDCVLIQLPGGQVSTECFDGGIDDGPSD